MLPNPVHRLKLCSSQQQQPSLLSSPVTYSCTGSFQKWASAPGAPGSVHHLDDAARSALTFTVADSSHFLCFREVAKKKTAGAAFSSAAQNRRHSQQTIDGASALRTSEPPSADRVWGSTTASSAPVPPRQMNCEQAKQHCCT